ANMVDDLISNWAEPNDQIRFLIATARESNQNNKALQLVEVEILTALQFVEVEILGPVRLNEPLSRPVVSQPTVRDPYLEIGKQLCWDREEPTKKFQAMLRLQPNPQYQILGIQAPKEADLDGLLLRFAEICEKLETKKPILCARVRLIKKYSAPASLV